MFKFAIVFKTPGYWNTAIEKPVQVLLELRRKSDKERSPAIEFTYKPQEFGKDVYTNIRYQQSCMHAAHAFLKCFSFLRRYFKDKLAL